MMRLSRTVLLSGMAALGMASLAGFARAQTLPTRVMTVQLPNGAVEQIRYSGDVPPQIVVVPGSASLGSPFAELAQMSALMNRQAEMMLRAISGMAVQPMTMPTTEAAIGRISPGSGVCMRSVRITYTGNGEPPRVVSQTAGDCGPSHGSAVPAELPGSSSPAPQHQHTIEVRASTPYNGLLNRVAEWRPTAAPAVN